MTSTPPDPPPGPDPDDLMSAAQVEKLFIAVTVEAAVSLFSAYHVSLVPLAFEDYQGSPSVSFVSAIGFVGEKIRGSLVLGTSREPLVHSMPLPAWESDWIAELSNQLLGRVKNQVLRRGIEFYVLPPSVVSGENLSHVTSDKESRPWIFTTPGGIVCLWIDLVVPGPIRPNPELIGSNIPAEGNTKLF